MRIYRSVKIHKYPTFSGIGYSIVQRLIEMHYSLGQDFIIVMACRNMKKALTAWRTLIKHLKTTDKAKTLGSPEESPLQLLEIDLSASESVVKACGEITKR